MHGGFLAAGAAAHGAVTRGGGGTSPAENRGDNSANKTAHQDDDDDDRKHEFQQHPAQCVQSGQLQCFAHHDVTPSHEVIETSVTIH